MRYRGIVKDRLNSLDTRKTKWYDTYEAAKKAAENLCRRTYGERGQVAVIDEEGYVQ